MEVLLASILLVFGVVSVVKVMSSGLVADNSVDGHVIALRLAQEGMEIIKNTPYASVAASSSTLAAPFAAYTRAVVVTGNPASDKKITVTVNVTWTYKSNTRTVTLVTLISDTTENGNSFFYSG